MRQGETAPHSRPFIPGPGGELRNPVLSWSAGKKPLGLRVCSHCSRGSTHSPRVIPSSFATPQPIQPWISGLALASPSFLGDANANLRDVTVLLPVDQRRPPEALRSSDGARRARQRHTSEERSWARQKHWTHDRRGSQSRERRASSDSN